MICHAHIVYCTNYVMFKLFVAHTMSCMIFLDLRSRITMKHLKSHLQHYGTQEIDYATIQIHLNLPYEQLS